MTGEFQVARCTHCGQSHGPHDRFCGRCRTALHPEQVTAAHSTAGFATAPTQPSWPPPIPAPTPAPRPSPPSPAPTPRGATDGHSSTRDDATTRYLCAAAHLDPTFADTAIREYLVEPTRPLPPTPGLDAAAVLRDAVAARTRRKLRDAALLLLLLVFAWNSPTLAVLWLGTAVAVAAASGRTRSGLAVAAAVAAGLLFLVLPNAGYSLASLLGGSGYGYGYGYGYGEAGSSYTGLVTGVVGLLILAVVLVDEWLVTELTRHRFRTRFEADPARLSGWEQSLRTLGHGWWAGGLRRVAEAAAPPPGTAEAIVYRTRNPFVGAGQVWQRRTLPLPLRPAERDTAGTDADVDPDADPDALPDLPPIAPAALLDAVARTVEELRGSVALAPTGRLRDVETREQVLVSAARLLRDPSAPAVDGVLPSMWHPPRSWIPGDRAKALANHPDEVARLHRCFRVEAWNRDLTVSCFLTASADRRTLYLEWNHCVLAPIREEYRGIDYVDDEGPGRRALLAAVLLPATVLARLGALFGWIRPTRRREGEIDPDLYGAGRSLRELAAADTPVEHFQIADAELYIQVLEQTVLRGVGSFLRTNGYSVATVREVAHNSITFIGGDQRGANIGIGRTTQHNDGPRPGRAGGPGPRSGGHGQ
jgi:hypothetical protein